MYFCNRRLFLILANSADPDVMQYYAAFHLGLHCLPNCPFRGFQYIKGSIMRICCILYLSSLNIGGFLFQNTLENPDPVFR